MTAKQLTNSILQMAIQGKLVPQNPNDEPASVLLDKIRKEKARLVKEKILKKSALKEEPITDNDKLFTIPSTWEWCKLGWIGDWGAGATPAKGTPEFYTNGTIPWLRTGELNNGIVIDSEIKVTPYALQKCSLRECKVGDVLIAMYGATIGKVAIAGIELTTNQACCACTPYQVYNKYLLYYLMASKQRFIDLGEGGAQPNISREKIVAFPFPLPPLAEQHRIVKRIEEILPFVKEYGDANEEASIMDAQLPDRLKKSVLQEAIKGKLGTQDPNDEPASVLLEQIREEKKRLVKEDVLKKKDLEETPVTEDEELFKIPESWEWCCLGNLIELISGRDLEPDKYNSVEKGIPYMTGASNFSNEKLIINRWTESPVTVSKLGDLLITCKGTIGAMAYNTIGDIHIARQIMAIRPFIIYVPYLKVYMHTRISELGKMAKSIIPGITRENVMESYLPLPPLAEQHRIVEKIEALFAEIDNMTINKDINETKIEERTE